MKILICWREEEYAFSYYNYNFTVNFLNFSVSFACKFKKNVCCKEKWCYVPVNTGYTIFFYMESFFIPLLIPLLAAP